MNQAFNSSAVSRDGVFLTLYTHNVHKGKKKKKNLGLKQTSLKSLRKTDITISSGPLVLSIF